MQNKKNDFLMLLIFLFFMIGNISQFIAFGQKTPINIVSNRTQKEFKLSPFVKQKAIPFSLSDVSLLEGPFKKAQEVDEKFILNLKVDKLLSRYLSHSALKPKDEVYSSSWETGGAGGHTLGHYLSASSMMYASTGNPKLKEKVDYTVGELAKCQKEREGYVGSLLGENSLWRELAAGDVRAEGGRLNGLFVPFYSWHKLWAGLIDAYTYTGNEQARQVVIGLADWLYNRLKNLTDQQWQQIMIAEHGGMLEGISNVYALTGDKKYLEMTNWFYHKELFRPLLALQDSLKWKHANTQLPKVVGLERRFELTGNNDDHKITTFFWETITNHHSYCNGGNSDWEHFGKPDKLGSRLSTQTTESCNTYNMLKLTKKLITVEPNVAKADYYEKALYNHILASQNPETGGFTYFVPLTSGCKREYQLTNFTCCTGTGMENHSKYGEAIYFKSEDEGLFINLYIPSILNWKEKGVEIVQEHTYPLNGNIQFKVNASTPKSFPIYLRYPSWAKQGGELYINGNKEKIEAKPGSYIKLVRLWGKDLVEFKLSMPLYLDPLPDMPDRCAIKYGPLLLAACLGKEEVRSSDIPVLKAKGKPVQQWLKMIDKEIATFKTQNVGFPRDIVFKPFYQVFDERYAVYFDFFTEQSWKENEKKYREELASEELLKSKTVDHLRLGEMQPERDHNFKDKNSFVSTYMGRKYRGTWHNGSFEFNLKIDPSVDQQLICTFNGNNQSPPQAYNRGVIQYGYELLVDDNLLISLNNIPEMGDDAFFDRKIDIPANIIKGKSTVKIKIRALKDHMVPRIFDCKVIKSRN